MIHSASPCSCAGRCGAGFNSAHQPVYQRCVLPCIVSCSPTFPCNHPYSANVSSNVGGKPFLQQIVVQDSVMRTTCANALRGRIYTGRPFSSDRSTPHPLRTYAPMLSALVIAVVLAVVANIEPTKAVAGVSTFNDVRRLFRTLRLRLPDRTCEPPIVRNAVYCRMCRCVLAMLLPYATHSD